MLFITVLLFYYMDFFIIIFQQKSRSFFYLSSQIFLLLISSNPLSKEWKTVNLPSLITQRSSEVASKKSLSCETIKETPLKSASIVLIASLEVKSRWLVGSSITTISGWARSIFARATLDLSPPERVQIFWSAFSGSMSKAPRKPIASLNETQGQTSSSVIVA